MSLNARKVKNNSGPKAPVLDEGAYPARLIQVVDLGVQPQEYKGETKPPKREIYVTYELSDEFMPGEDGEPDESKPRWLSERFALNHLDSDRATSTKRYYALDPNEEEDGEWTELIGRPCLLTVVKYEHKGELKNKIGGTSAMRPKEAAKLPDLVNPTKVFLFDSPDVEVFLSLPDWMQDIIKNGLEFEGSKLETLLNKHKGKGTKAEKEDKKPSKKKQEVVEEDDISFENNNESSEGDNNDDW